MPTGYNGKLLCVDLTDRSISTRPVTEDTIRSYLGGVGLGARIIYDAERQGKDPLGPCNPLCLMPGLLAGTAVPGANRTAVCAQSPATGRWGEARAGGQWAPQLKLAGYDGVVITGKASSPAYIWIDNDDVEIRPADHIWGKGFFEADHILIGETHPEAVVAGIGPGGERLSAMACVMFEGRYARSAGRTGMGAVMGSKNLKAVVVRGSGGIKVADKENLRTRILEFIKNERDTFKTNFHLGTAGTVEGTETAGDMPIRNFLGGHWKEGAEKLAGHTLFDKHGVREQACFACPLGCTLIVESRDNTYRVPRSHAPEYETIGSFGSTCDNDHLESVIKANDLCNDYGIDTISAGVAIAFAIEAFDKGLITEADTGGIRLKWGDHEAIIAMIHKIGKREDIGDILADGLKKAVEKLGESFKEMAVEVKNVEIPMHDPRAFVSNALNYAVSNRGACHMEGMTFTIEMGLPVPDLGYNAPMDPFTTEGKAEVNFKMHNLMSLYDSLGICKFYLIPGHGPNLFSEWVKYTTGIDLTPDEMMKTGERIFNLKRLYNIESGATARDDYIPVRLMTVPQREDIPPIDKTRVEAMLKEYYKLRGWTEAGVPTKKKLKELNLA